MSTASSAPELRDPRSLWSWLRVFLILYMIVIAAIAVLGALFFLIGGEDPNFTPRDMQSILITLGYVGSSFVALIVFVASIVLTVRVTFRMMKNLHQIGSGYASISSGWAVGSYFIPFVNLVMPVRAVGEIWRGTFAEIEGVPPKEPAGAIGWWWAFWILGNILDNVGARLQGTSPLGQQTPVPHDQAVAGLVVSSIAAGCLFLAAAFLFALFRTLVRAQTQMVNAAAMS